MPRIVLRQTTRPMNFKAHCAYACTGPIRGGVNTGAGETGSGQRQCRDKGGAGVGGSAGAGDRSSNPGTASGQLRQYRASRRAIPRLDNDTSTCALLPAHALCCIEDDRDHSSALIGTQSHSVGRRRWIRPREREYESITQGTCSSVATPGLRATTWKTHANLLWRRRTWLVRSSTNLDAKDEPEPLYQAHDDR